MILTQPCPVCHGRGTTCEGRTCPSDDRLKDVCPHCVNGAVPTDAGRRVLALVESFGSFARAEDVAEIDDVIRLKLGVIRE